MACGVPHIRDWTSFSRTGRQVLYHRPPEGLSSFLPVTCHFSPILCKCQNKVWHFRLALHFQSCHSNSPQGRLLRQWMTPFSSSNPDSLRELCVPGRFWHVASSRRQLSHVHPCVIPHTHTPTFLVVCFTRACSLHCRYTPFPLSGSLSPEAPWMGAPWCRMPPLSGTQRIHCRMKICTSLLCLCLSSPLHDTRWLLLEVSLWGWAGSVGDGWWD